MIAGPTAVGKTRLAIEIAEHYQTEIISADARQFYSEMRIGTARPSDEELRRIPHHFIASRTVSELYGAGHFADDALKLLECLFRGHDVVVMTGGSGLYIDAVVHGVDDFEEVPPEVREELTRQYREKGITWLQDQVEKADPEFYKHADPKNPQRLLRALEVTLHTGKPFSSLRRNSKKDRPFEVIGITLELPRAQLYENINERADRMVAEGLLEEARSLYHLRSLNALQTVGYKELFEHFDGRCTVSEAVEKIKQHTRNYAKRQMTWFRNKTSFAAFHPDDVSGIVKYIEGQRQ